ncbi:MAG: S53 family peptidase [Aliidongia sp.]
MLRRRKSGFLPILLGLMAAVGIGTGASAQTNRQLVTQAIDERQTVELTGNLRPEATVQNDRGLVADSLTLDHMQLLLKRPAETEAALVQFIDLLHNPGSPYFHRWLTAEEFGADFGPAAGDIQAVRTWLEAHGFTVNGVQTSGMVVDFSGTAGQIREAFRSEIHRLDVGGVPHIANMSDPRIPAALAPVVKGVVSLHDFRPHTNYRPRSEYTFSSGGSTFQALVPADLATIYNLNPLFTAGISGQGQTVVVIEDTNVFSTADWTTFRSTFGLSGFTSGSFTQVHPAPPTGPNNCTNPGVVAGNEGEAELDAEWASASAPSAAIELASCKDTSTTFGGLIALQNLVNAGSPPAIVSISYGECEAENGATANAAFNSVYQQAVTLGVSVFVSAGDEGAASCDADQTKATHGIGVSGFASTPYNVAVGGTDFSDTFSGTQQHLLERDQHRDLRLGEILYPGDSWNDSCASVLIATTEGFSTTYGTSGFCNSTTGRADFLTTASGSGGPSGCATGTPSTSGVVSGSCAGYAKPSWQSLVGVPADGVRDLPDVSLFAANGVWGHYYVYCDSDTHDGGAVCTGAPSGWSGAGGTSFSSPILAGIQALVNQKTGARQGNPNPVYYALAAAEYGSGGSSSCNSSNGNTVGSSCIFYDVTLGDMDVNCTGTHSCYRPSGTNGVLSTSTSSYLKAYGTGTGWDFATGIGTLNAANLVNNW